MAVASWSVSFRAIATTRNPDAASLCIIPSPSPRLPPVTRMLRMTADQLSRSRDVERCHLVQNGGNLMGAQRAAAQGADLAFDCLEPDAGCIGPGIRHDLRDHDCPGDRTRPRRDARHVHGWMPVDYRLDYLRMDLEAADIDD